MRRDLGIKGFRGRSIRDGEAVRLGLGGSRKVEGGRSRCLRGSVLGLALSFGFLASAYPQAANQTALKTAGATTWTVPANVPLISVLE